MGSRFALLILAAASYLLFKAAPSMGAEIHCPESISETPSVSINDKTWTVVTKTGERSIEHVGIYLGTVSEYGAQDPDSTKKVRLRETVTWNIVRSPTDGFWVGCTYVGTTAILLKKLDPEIKQCVAIYELLPTGRRQRLITFGCQ